MTQFAVQLRKAPRWQRATVYGLGSLALAPVVFMSRVIVTGNFAGMADVVADVLGSGALIVFLAMLTVTPTMAVTGQRWFVPLRWWFGIMFFAIALTDLVIASITTGGDFKGGFVSRLAGHTFLLVGTAMVLLSAVLAATASHRAQRWLGRYWKPLQRITYAVWALVLLHLALLFGVGPASRFTEALAASVPLAVLRVPVVRRWWEHERRRAGWHSPWLWTAGLVLAALFVFGMAHLVGEEVNRGVDALSNTPDNPA